MIVEFGQWIGAQLTDLELGEDFFVGVVPAEQVQDCVAITEPQGPYIPPEGQRSVEWHFQIYTRGKLYLSAREQNLAIVRLLKANQAGARAGNWAFTVPALSGPAYMHTDAMGRHQFVSNVSLLAYKEG